MSSSDVGPQSHAVLSLDSVFGGRSVCGVPSSSLEVTHLCPACPEGGGEHPRLWALLRAGP